MRIVDGSDHPPDGCLLHLVVVVGGLVRWPGQRLQLEVVPWSPSNTELRLCPVGIVHPTSRYFRAGHAVMDRLVAEIGG